MRVALISTVQAFGDGDGSTGGQNGGNRAFSMVAGRSIAERQIALALSLGCERVACLATGMPPEIIALQHVTERAGATFHTIRKPSDLAALITATDDVLAFADGLLPERNVTEKLVQMGRSIAILPVATAMEAGFERIDRDWGWAGIMMVPGHLVERLSDLPSDSEPIAALLRIALQSQVKTTRLDEELLDQKRWMLVTDEQSVAAMETAWLGQRINPARLQSPSRALADRLSLRFAGVWLCRGVGSAKLAAGSIASVAISAIVGWFFDPVYGLIGAGLGYLFACLAASLARIEDDGELRPDGLKGRLLAGNELLVDAGIILSLALNAAQEARLMTIFAGVILLGLLRMAERSDLKVFIAFVADRFVLSAILIATVFTEIAFETIQIISVVLLLALMLRHQAFRLTQV